MSKVAEPAFVAETLAWCNEMRAKKDMEPLDVLPRGRRSHGLSCPCGAATGLFVGFTIARTSDTVTFVCNLPEPVKRFVYAFDDGQLPQYDEAAA